ncbi:MAG: 2-oxoglutarate dehydrogenase complex dihydrolipoyllysine-residue succinyltransferase, partial [Alphaproteobacteria bacterium]|nr:2-oxoglutarate dehydrogenase complex dihydrolipoyllysine-residue succinyltransferase [Alphaproteobacteria bacterium]
GTTVAIGALLGRIAEGAAGVKTAPSAKPAAPPLKSAVASTPAARTAATLSPAVQKAVTEQKLDPNSVPGTGKGGRISKGDVIAHVEAKLAAGAPSGPRSKEDREERVRMTRLRLRIAERLKQAQNTAAMLTTYNEADMSAVLNYRERYRDEFEKKHGVRLGFMGFFVKAAIAALKEIPAVNGEIDGAEIVYKNYYDIGVAVGTEQGLLVPVIRDADRLSFADVEKTIADFGERARDGKIAVDELQGGTFTISNGGVYGSLMSSPILNPPQSGILGMHKIQKRPMVVGDQIVARPMMYLALSYDHRIIDGREAVTFLVRVKECIENPDRLLFGL